MNKILKLSLIIFVLSLTLTGISLSYRANVVLTSLNTSLLAAQMEIHGISQNTNAALIQIGLISDQARLASMEQRKYWQKNSKETHDVLVSLNKTILRAKDTLSDLDSAVLVNGAESAKLLQSARQTTQIASLAGLDLAKLIHDTGEQTQLIMPQVQKTAEGLAQTSANIAIATDSLAHASKDIEGKIHQVTRPASFAKSVGIFVLDVGAKLGSILTGFVK